MAFKRFISGVLASAMILTVTPSYTLAAEFANETISEDTAADDSVENSELSTNTVDLATEDSAEETGDEGSDDISENDVDDDQVHSDEQGDEDEFQSSPYKVSFVSNGCEFCIRPHGWSSDKNVYSEKCHLSSDSGTASFFFVWGKDYENNYGVSTKLESIRIKSGSGEEIIEETTDEDMGDAPCYKIYPITCDIEVELIFSSDDRFIALSEEYDDSKFILTPSGGGTEYGKYRSDHKEITYTIGKTDQKIDLNGYTYTATYSFNDENGNVIEKEAVSDPKSPLKFKIPKEDVWYAENAHDSAADPSGSRTLNVKLVATPKQVGLTVAPDNPASVYLYDTKTQSDNGLIEAPDEPATIVPYGEDVYIHVFPDNYCPLESVKVGNTSATLVGDGIYKIPGTALKSEKNKIVVTTEAENNTDTGKLVIESSDNCLVTKVDKATKGDDGWTISKNAQNLTITIETKGSHILTSDSFALFDPDEEQESGWSASPVGDVMFNLSQPALNKTKDGLVYTLSGSAIAYKGRKLTVTSKGLRRELHVDLAHINSESLQVKQNGMIVKGEKDGDHKVYPTTGIIDPFATYVISATPDDGFKLTGSGTVNGGRVTVKNGTISTTAAFSDKDGYVDVAFGCEPVAALFERVGGNEVYVPNNKEYKAVNENKTFVLRSGDEALQIDSINITPAKAVKDGYYTISANTFTVSKDKVADASKPVKLAITAKSSAGKKCSYNVSLNYIATLTEVKVKGADSKGIIKQTAGTEVKYPLTFNANADVSDLSVKIVSDSPETNAEVSLLGDEKDVLQVQTCCIKSGKTTVAEKDIKVGFYKGTEGEPFATFTVKPAAPKLAAPTVSILNVSDVNMLLSIYSPKGADDLANLYYRIEAKADKKAASVIEHAVDPVYVPANPVGVEYIHELVLENVGTLGKEAEQKYIISVSLVQARVGVDDYSGGENEPFAASAAKTLSEKARKPAYEVKMGFTKKTTTFTKGETTLRADGKPLYEEGWVCLGMAKFSNTTSFTSVDEYYTVLVSGGSEFHINGSLKLGEDKLSIWVNSDNIPAGPAVLTVYAALPNGASPVSIDVPVTVKTRIKDIKIAPSDRVSLYKQDGKAATMKFTATLNSEWGIKPASSKVKWAIDKDSPMYGHVSIDEKSGTVTVDKDYVLDSDQTKNRFSVYAMADDIPVFSADPVKSAKTTVTVCNTSIRFRTVVYDYYNNPISREQLENGVDPLSLKGASIQFLDSDYNPIPLCELTIKWPSKGFDLDRLEESKAYIKNVMAGTFTITAAANDGGKFSDKITIKNNGLQITAVKLGNADVPGEATPAKDLVGKTLVFRRKDLHGVQEVIDPELLTFTCSSGIIVDEDGKICSVSKKGKLKVTAAPKDGSKSRKVVDIEVAPIEIGSVELNVEHPDQAIESKNLLGKSFTVKDTEGTVINFGDLEITSSSGIKVSDAGVIESVTKDGEFTVTFKTKDGGNSSKAVKVKVKASDEESYEISEILDSDGSDINAEQVSGGGQPLKYEGSLKSSNMVMARFTRTDSAFAFNADLSVSGGTLVSTVKSEIPDAFHECEAKFFVKPKVDNDPLVLTLKYGKGAAAKTITITFEKNIGEGDALSLKKGTKAESVSAPASAYPLKDAFTFASKKPVPEPRTGNGYKLVFQHNEAYYKLKKDTDKNAYDTLRSILNTAGADPSLNEEKTEITTNAAAYNAVPVGTYKFDVTLAEFDSKGKFVKAVTKPVTITFTARAGKKASAKLETKPVEINYSTGSTGSFPFASSSTFSSAEIMEVYSNNDKGQVNAFGQLFAKGNISYDPSTRSLILKRTGNSPIDAGVEFEEGQAALTGWIKYKVIPEDGDEEKAICNTEKVTVILNEPEGVKVIEDFKCSTTGHGNPVSVDGGGNEGQYFGGVTSHKTLGRRVPISLKLKSGDKCSNPTYDVKYKVGNGEYKAAIKRSGYFEIPREDVKAAEEAGEDITIRVRASHN